MNRFFFLGFLIMVGCFTTISAQEDFVATGGDASSSTGSISYSIGLVAYQYYSSVSGGSVNEGVQQPYQITNIGIENEDQPEVDVKLYPNPTDEYLNLQINIKDLASVYFEIYDLQGKCLIKKPVTSQITFVSLQGLANATYILNLYNKSVKIKSLKIIKNQ